MGVVEGNDGQAGIVTSKPCLRKERSDDRQEGSAFHGDSEPHAFRPSCSSSIAVGSNWTWIYVRFLDLNTLYSPLVKLLSSSCRATPPWVSSRGRTAPDPPHLLSPTPPFLLNTAALHVRPRRDVPPVTTRPIWPPFPTPLSPKLPTRIMTPRATSVASTLCEKDAAWCWTGLS